MHFMTESWMTTITTGTKMHKPEVPGGGLRKLLLIGICHLGTGLINYPNLSENS